MTSGDAAAARAVRAVVLRTMTVEPLIDRLRSALRQSSSGPSLALTATMGGYLSSIEELDDEQQRGLATADVVMVMWEPRDLLPDSWSTMTVERVTADEVDAHADRLCTRAADLIDQVRSMSTAPIMWHTLIAPQRLRHGSSVTAASTALAEVCRRFNAWLLAGADSDRSLSVVDLAALATQVGHETFFDERFWMSSHMPWSGRGLAAIADAQASIITRQLGHVRKCLILDCDETLWGGVLDEVGIEGLILGESYPGSAYQAFQREVLSLREQGVLLAICSKNDLDDVRAVFDTHPGMLLKWSDLSAVRVNWNDKASNLREIAAELNLGVDALAFVDDRRHELDLVSSLVPEVMCIEVDATRPSLHAARVREIRCFDLSDGGLADRSAQYADQQVRAALASSAVDAAAYQAGLRTVVRLRGATGFDAARLEEMVRRTNQFNTTGVRHSAAEITAWIADPDVDVRLCEVSDAIGDLGVVGAVVIERSGTESMTGSSVRSAAVPTVRLMLLSCRAFSRAIEAAMLADALLLTGAGRGAGAGASLRVELRTTQKNRLAREFLDQVAAEAPTPGEGSAPDAVLVEVDGVRTARLLAEGAFTLVRDDATVDVASVIEELTR